METTSYAIYSRGRDAFGAEYHTIYNSNLSLEQAQRSAREASQWGTRGTTYIIVKEVKTIELLDGPEFRFEVQPQPNRAEERMIDDWDE